MAQNCNQSVITNISDGEVTLTMLGTKVLAAGESFSVPGDIYAYIAAFHPGLRGRANMALLKSLVDADKLEITLLPSSPCAIGSSSSSSSSSS